MTRAEKRALELFPVDMQMCIDNMGEPYEADVNAPRRKYVAYGYEQAEKDLALTKDDVWCIFNLVRELQTKYPATEGCLQEVADIFNEQKNK